MCLVAADAQPWNFAYANRAEEEAWKEEQMLKGEQADDGRGEANKEVQESKL